MFPPRRMKVKRLIMRKILIGQRNSIPKPKDDVKFPFLAVSSIAPKHQTPHVLARPPQYQPHCAPNQTHPTPSSRAPAEYHVKPFPLITPNPSFSGCSQGMV